MGTLHQFKIILVGQCGVGKTSLLLRFAENKFYETPQSTLQVDTKDVFLNVNGKECILEIHDTAGQETFWSLGTRFFRGADGVILVYDETSVDSYDKISNWIKHVQEHCGDETIMILAGNKTDDKEKKSVIDATVKVFAESMNLEVIKTSAKNGVNVKEVFLRLIRKIVISKGIVEEGTDTSIEVLEAPVQLLRAIDESKISSTKESRSRFIAKHESRLTGIRILPFASQSSVETQTDDTPVTQASTTGCSCVTL